MLTRKVLLAGVAGIALVAALGTAYAVTSTDFTYSTAKAGYYTIDMMAVGPSGTVAADSYAVDYGSGFLLGAGCFHTGVNLPDGARILSVVTWYASNASSNPTVIFIRTHLPTGQRSIVINAAIADNSDVRKPQTHNIAPMLSIVSNAHYSYGYSICIGAGTKFYAARINYTYSNAGS